MKHSMDYLSLIQSIPAHRTALIEDGRFYTYGTLVMEACRNRSLSPEPAAPSVAWIKAASVHGQLVRFLAFSGTSRVPVIVPADMKYVPESLITEEIPAGACMVCLPPVLRDSQNYGSGPWIAGPPSFLSKIQSLE